MMMSVDIKCAPVWNSERRDFEGMITVTDFIDVLLQFYHSEDYDHGEFANRLGDYTVLQWNGTHNTYRLICVPIFTLVLLDFV